jgi:hypothetical protein
VLLAIPAFLLSRSWLPASVWAYTLAGIVIAVFPASIFAFFFRLRCWHFLPAQPRELPSG